MAEITEEVEMTMKTLDEVIKMAEHCWQPMPKSLCVTCPSKKRYSDCDLLNDALHYLKEYQAILPLVPSLINTAIAVQKKGKTIG